MSRPTSSAIRRTDRRRRSFASCRAQESKAREVYYGADVGTISMTVFREKKGPDKPMAVVLKEADEAEDLAALSRGVFPEEQPRNLAALQAQLRDSATRGLIAQGEKTSSEVQRVKFNADPIPVMSATITYYKP